MFTVHCTTHGSRVLLGASNVERLVNTLHGIELHFRCHCGTRGVLVTGALAEAHRADAVPSSEADEGHEVEPLAAAAGGPVAAA